jgi:hypothetical protein
VRELTAQDLATVASCLPYVEELANIDCVHDVQVALKVNGEQVLLGYGESGEPALLG